MRRLIWTAPLAVLVLVACSAEQTALEESHARANVGSCTATVTSSEFDSPVAPNTGGHHAHFTVTNTTDSSEAISPSCSTLLNATCTGLNVTSPFNLTAHTAQDVIATFSVGASPNKGAVKLTACTVTASDQWVLLN
jgi:uncharacterized lipoprotein NlpE involved in copper resistance